MTERDGPHGEPKASSFNLTGCLALLMVVGCSGAGIVGGYQEHQRGKYEAFDPSKEATLLDKTEGDQGGGLRYRPGMPIPFGFSLESGSQDTPTALVFGQPVENGRGETAIAVCRLAVSKTIFDSHQEGERIAPDQVKHGCEEITALRMPLSEAVEKWPVLQTPAPN